MSRCRAAERWVLAALIVVVALAAAVRISGVWFGYPLALHADEGRVVRPALKIAQTGDLNPHFFNYPSLTIYLQAALFKVAAALGVGAHGASGGADPKIAFYILGRILTVVMSLVTIVVSFLIGRRLIGLTAGLVAATVVGVSTLHTLNSFTITVDVPMTMWSSLAVYMAARLATGKRTMADYILGGLFVGLAIGSKYTAVFAVAPILVGHFVGRDDGEAGASRRLLVALATILVAFLLTTPFAVLDHATFRDAIAVESKHYREGHFGFEAEGATSLHLYARALLRLGLGPVGSALALGGLVWLALARPRRALLLSSFPLLLVLFVGLYKVFFDRNVVAAIPCLAVFSGAGATVLSEALGSAWSRLRMKRVSPKCLAGSVVALGVIAGAWQQVALARESIRVLTLPDTRWTSLQWISDNIAPGSAICRERYAPPVQHLGGRFDVTNLGFFSLTRKATPAKIDRCDYVVLSSFNFERFFDNPDRYPRERRAYQRFFSTHRLIQEFVPDELQVGGPRILVFAVDRDDTAKPPG